jgi:hypothetical protein
VQGLAEKQAECLENAAWYLERAAVHSVFKPYSLVMAACWEGLASGFSEQASGCATPPSNQQCLKPVLEDTDSSVRQSASSTCIKRAAEAERDASRTDNASLKQSLLRLACAWRRLASAYELSEDVERKSR